MADGRRVTDPLRKKLIQMKVEPVQRAHTDEEVIEVAIQTMSAMVRAYNTLVETVGTFNAMAGDQTLGTHSRGRGEGKAKIKGLGNHLTRRDVQQ